MHTVIQSRVQNLSPVQDDAPKSEETTAFTNPKRPRIPPTAGIKMLEFLHGTAYIDASKALELDMRRTIRCR